MSRWIAIALLYGFAVLAWGTARAVRAHPNGERSREPVLYALCWMFFNMGTVRLIVPWVTDWNYVIGVELTRWAMITATIPVAWIVFGFLMRPWVKRWRVW